jgi:hypothetical protein
MALTALRVATRFIGTWNWAIEPLDVFLTEIQFGGKEFGFTPPQQKLNFVSDFIDQVLRHNSQNWDDEAAFMDYLAIRTKWQGDVVQRFGRAGTAYRKFEQKPKQSTESTQQSKSTGQRAAAQAQTTFSIPPFPADLCRRYQQGTCTQQESRAGIHSIPARKGCICVPIGFRVRKSYVEGKAIPSQNIERIRLCSNKRKSWKTVL